MAVSPEISGCVQQTQLDGDRAQQHVWWLWMIFNHPTWEDVPDRSVFLRRVCSETNFMFACKVVFCCKHVSICFCMFCFTLISEVQNKGWQVPATDSRTKGSNVREAGAAATNPWDDARDPLLRRVITGRNWKSMAGRKSLKPPGSLSSKKYSQHFSLGRNAALTKTSPAKSWA